MQSVKNYVGIDISKLDFDVAIENEGRYKHSKLPNHMEGFKKLYRMLPIDSHVVIEASGPYYLQLATYLYDQGLSVSVVNPLVIRRFCQMRLSRAKTDKKDAQMIAMYGKTELPKLWQPDAGYVLELRQMQAAVEGYSKSRTSMMRQKEAFLRNTFISRDTIESLDTLITSLELQIASLECKMEQLIKEHHQDMFKALQTNAWSAKRYNQTCKELYERLVTKGKSKRLALIAVANKLIKQAFAIVTKGLPYQPDYSKKICF